MSDEIIDAVTTIYRHRRDIHTGKGYRKIIEVADTELAKMCYCEDGLDYWTERTHIHVYLDSGVNPTIDVVIDEYPVLTILGDFCEADYNELADRWDDVGPIIKGLAEVCA